MKRTLGLLIGIATVFSCSGMSFDDRCRADEAERKEREKRLPNEVRWGFEEAAKAVKRCARMWQSDMKEILTTQGLVHTCEQRTRCYNGCTTFMLEHKDEDVKAACDRMSELVEGITESELAEIETITAKLNSFDYKAITDAEIARMHAIIGQYRAIKKVDTQFEVITAIWDNQMSAMLAIKKEKEKKCIVM